MADDFKNNGAENLFDVFNKHFDEYLERYGVANPKPSKAEPKSTGNRFPGSSEPVTQEPEAPAEEEEYYLDPADYDETVEESYEEIPAEESEELPETVEEVEEDFYEPATEEVPAEVYDEAVYEDEPVDEAEEVFEPVEEEPVDEAEEVYETVGDEPVEEEFFDPEAEEEVPSYESDIEDEGDVYFDPDAVDEEPEYESEQEQPQRTVEREILREVLVVDRDQAKDLGYGADRYFQEEGVPAPRQQTSYSAPTFTPSPVYVDRTSPQQTKDDSAEIEAPEDNEVQVPKISDAPRVEKPKGVDLPKPVRITPPVQRRPEPEAEKRGGFLSNLFGARKAETDRETSPTRDYRETSRVREEGLDSSSFDSTDENSPIRLNTQENYDPRAERLRLQHIVTERRDVDPAVWLEETMRDALQLDASDLHIVVDGETRDLRARIRVDGQMRDFDYVQGVPARVIMGRLKAATELSSGGSFAPEETIYTIELDGEQRKARAVLFRVEDGGEALVMRLPLTGSLRQLDELDFAEYNLQHVLDLLAMPYKLIMIAGPMGSGKTTTAHGALMHVAKQTRTVWTIEDPVERRLPNLVQLEIDEDNGAGFDVLLSKLLRADYNTLFLGEIRDNATAAAAVRQAKAGRQVMSTIHADDNIKALMRLIELAGDSPLSVLSAVGGVISQRLVRRLNPNWDGVDLETKYKGRVPIHEILFVDDNLVEVMMEGKALSQIKQATAEAKGSTFAEDARRLIAAGVTDRAELLAVIGEYEEKK